MIDTHEANPAPPAINAPPRPMLARDADSLYWLARYVERAEHVARLLLVNSNLLMDVGDLTPNMQQRLWLSVLTILRLDVPSLDAGPVAQRIGHFMAFDSHNASSLLSCLTHARENARSIREIISAEMWECVNSLYWSIKSEEAPLKFEDSPEEFYRQIMDGSMLFQGLTDQTLSHDQRWLFMQVAKHFERIDVTCRVLQTKLQILEHADTKLEAALRNIHWMAVLRSCGSIEAYRRSNMGEMDATTVASFLILQRNFPRSIRFCVERACDAISAIRFAAAHRAIDPAERILGRLNAQLEYVDMQEILDSGLGAYLHRIQSTIAEAALAVQKTYFLH
ncbi:MAG: alpha-E domain-containing protein [Tepidisphaeraceae bacterium]